MHLRHIEIIRSILIGACVLVALLISAIMFYLPNQYVETLYAQQDAYSDPNSLWDLRDYNLDTGYAFVHASNGGVQYAPGVLLAPDEFDAYNGVVLYESFPATTKVATARLRLAMPDDDIYMLATISNDYNDRIFINGELRWEVGNPALTAEQSVPSLAYVYFEARPVNGIIEIVRQSSNFVHKDSGSYVGFYVAWPAVIRHQVALKTLLTAIGMGLYLCMFVQHLILLLMIRDYRPILWFFIICLCWFFRSGHGGCWVLWALFSAMPWALTYRINMAALALIGILVLAMMRDEFPGILQKWPRRFFYAGLAGYIPYYFLAPVYDVSIYKSGCEALLIAAALYLLVRFFIVVPHLVRSGTLHLGQSLRKSAASGVARGLVGGLLLGPVGLLAAATAKSKGIYQVALQFKDGKRTLVEVDDKRYKLLLKRLF